MMVVVGCQWRQRQLLGVACRWREGARASEKGAWAGWECNDESEEGLRSIGRRVGEEDGGPGPPVLAEEEGRIGDVDV